MPQPKTRKNFVIGCMAAALCLPALAGCGGAEAVTFKLFTAGVTGSAYGLFSNPKVNLKEKNYAAADYLVQQMRERVERDDMIVARPLEEEDFPGISSVLGARIAEEVGLRLSELGYTVFLNETVPEGHSNLYPIPPAGRSPDFVIKGTYLKKPDNVSVKLKMINIKTGQITASFDYPLALSPEVRDITKTEPRAYKIRSP